ncbi:hypothetical protein OPV22_018715 [Ensete ventricosum]|uniref:FLZ-type domain-containing protein n=1 Tax=Ensete ventricosum TaxID=4639 RepID=A0AAV8QWJ5_ENSVE|nr:hypothetical protein OPV22_018715 [Ensete ventricosum]
MSKTKGANEPSSVRSPSVVLPESRFYFALQEHIVSSDKDLQPFCGHGCKKKAAKRAPALVAVTGGRARLSPATRLPARPSSPLGFACSQPVEGGAAPATALEPQPSQ